MKASFPQSTLHNQNKRREGQIYQQNTFRVLKHIRGGLFIKSVTCVTKQENSYINLQIQYLTRLHFLEIKCNQNVTCVTLDSKKAFRLHFGYTLVTLFNRKSPFYILEIINLLHRLHKLHLFETYHPLYLQN